MVRLQWTGAGTKAHSASNADTVGSRRMRKRIALIVLLGLPSGGLAQSGVSPQSAQASAQKPKADLIFTHGNIFTGVVDAAASLGSGKRAEALAVFGDRILAVGARDEIMKLKGPETKIVDLDGHFVMPGFNA